MPLLAKVFISLVVVGGLGTLTYAATHQGSKNIAEFICYLGIAVLASRLKVSLPGITGTLSVNFLFILIGVLELSFTETLILGAIAMVAQCLYPDRPKALQLTFNVCAGSISTTLAYVVYHHPLINLLLPSRPVLLGLSATVYFIANAGSIATVISLTERRPLTRILVDCYFWSFPYYLVGAGIAGIIAWLNQKFTWEMSLLVLPAVYLIYRSYRLYLGKLEDEKRHVEEMANLHLRTIEALALAIDAKDHTTHEHLSRVRTYAIELAQEMKLPQAELEALRAAALLHDIGKLAVPEHIISKPGKLTPEEFEKMKIHPVVGAEILERVEFPYPVVPVVRSHHEKWDGSGYPDGLKGTDIPIGARILSAVDCLDALASDRQYRRALPLDQAMAEVEKLAGRSFDPEVVTLLKKRYVELEQKATSQNKPMTRLSTDVRVERGDAPDAGFEVSEPAGERHNKEYDFLDSIAAARQEAQLLFEFTQDLGSSLSLDETLSVVATRLKRLVPYDAIAVWVCRDGHLVPEYVTGEGFRFLSSLQIPIGQGLSGWVAHTGRTVLNGNPAVESGYLDDATKFTTLRSAVAVPLVGLNGTMGVITLYQTDRDAFSSDHVRLLQSIGPKVSLAMDNAMKYRQAETSATTDYLTELPNARSLFLRLDSELARCKRTGEPLTVLVCDLDGFKNINDQQGHLMGNKVLRAVGTALRESCREYDYVARMGGDEFVLILPASDCENMQRRIAQLRDIGAHAGCEAAGVRRMTMSIGEAFFPSDGTDAEQLLAEADRRMYQAKQGAKLRRLEAPLLADTPALATIQ